MTIHEVVLALTPWTRHHANCARVLDAGACTCGLQDVLIVLKAADHESHSIFAPRVANTSLDVVGGSGCKASTETKPR